MKALNIENLNSVLEIARSAAWGASDILRGYYRDNLKISRLEIQNKKGGPVTNADLAANRYILEQLQNTFKDQDCGYLTEETYKASNTLPFPNEWVWIVDPLDGTRDFIEGTGEYAIHIALVHQQRPVLAVVAMPEAEKIYYAVSDQGTFVETRQGDVQAVRVHSQEHQKDLSIVVSRTHRDERFNQLLEKIAFKEQKFVGSVGCKIVSLIEGQADVYISLSGKSAPKDWDMAAPELILTEAGGQFTHFDGSPLTYNKEDISQWGGLMASCYSQHSDLCQQAAETLAAIDAQSA